MFQGRAQRTHHPPVGEEWAVSVTKHFSDGSLLQTRAEEKGTFVELSSLLVMVIMKPQKNRGKGAPTSSTSRGQGTTVIIMAGKTEVVAGRGGAHL